MTYYTTINASPRADQIGPYAQARALQQKVGQVAGELARLDGQPADLDPAADAVTVSNAHLNSLGQTASGSVSLQRGELSSLSVRCADGSTLEFKKLPAGARAYASRDLVVVQTRDGGLRIGNSEGNADKAIEDMRPLSAGARLLEGARGVTAAVAGTLAGAIPGVGIPLHFALGSSGWASGDARVALGFVGIKASLVGTAALAARYISFGGHSLAPFAGPVAVAGLAVSAICAGCSAFVASGRDA